MHARLAMIIFSNMGWRALLIPSRPDISTRKSPPWKLANPELHIPDHFFSETSLEFLKNFRLPIPLQLISHTGLKHLYGKHAATESGGYRVLGQKCPHNLKPSLLDLLFAQALIQAHSREELLEDVVHEAATILALGWFGQPSPLGYHTRSQRIRRHKKGPRRFNAGSQVVLKR